jgi:hypothetical protein
MQGHVVFHDLKFVWETVNESVARAGPRRCTLRVAFGDLYVARTYTKKLTKSQAEYEAARLAPEVLKVG